MKILSISFSNFAPFSGSWSIDLTSPCFEKTSGYALFGKNNSYDKVLIDAVTLSLYGISFFRNSSDISDNRKENIASEIKFSCGNTIYKAKFSLSYSGGETLEKRVFKYDSNEVIDDNLTTINKTIETITKLDQRTFKQLLFIKPENFLKLLSSDTTEKIKEISNFLGDDKLKYISSLTKDIAKRKRIAAEVSRKMVDAFELLSSEEEDELNRELLILKSNISSLKDLMKKNSGLLEQLEQIEAFKEELQKVLKDENVLKADIARFDIKKPVLEKSVKAEELSFDYNLLKLMRIDFTERQKQLDENRSKLTISTDKFKNFQSAFEESEKALRVAERNYSDKEALLQKGIEIENTIAELRAQIKDKKLLLDGQQTELKTLSDSLASLKDSYNVDKNKQQLLLKKISDIGADDKLRDELSSYQAGLDFFDKINRDIENSIQEQKNLQKELEKTRSEFQENESLLTSLKKEEVFLQSDVVIKERHISKALGSVTEESLYKDLEVFEGKLSGLNDLKLLIEKIASLYESFTSEKDILTKYSNEFKVATVALNNSAQIYKDKQTIVSDAETILLFQQKVKNLESQRQQLENGKPCPLCGAIHHPYVSSPPFITNAEEKLAEALEEEKKSHAVLSKAKEQVEILQESMTASKNIIEGLNDSIKDLTAEILGLASQLGISGFKEKKVISWSQIVRQRMTFLSNKRDDLQSKIEQINSYKNGCNESVGKLTKVKASITELCELLETQKLRISETVKKLQKCDQDHILLSTQKENLFKDFEKFYLRYGIKVTSIASLKQQMSMLVNRRESYIENNNALTDINNKLDNTNFAIQDCQESIASKKSAISDLESEINRCDSEEKKLNKEKNDTLGGLSSQEFKENALKEFEKQKTASQQVRASFTQKEKEHGDLLQYVSNLEKQLELLSKELDLETSNFETKLTETGFSSEAQFSASRISAQQKEELQRENDQLNARKEEILHLKQTLEEKISVLSQGISSDETSPAKLKENIETQQAQLRESTSREALLSEKIEHNLYNKQRFERESLEQRKRENESLRWEDFVTMLSNPSLLADKNFVISLAFDILIDFSNKQLSSLNSRYSIIPDPVRPFNILLVDEYIKESSKRTEDMTAEEKYFVSLALALGFYQMIERISDMNLVFLDERSKTDNAYCQQWLLSAVAKLSQQEKQVGVFVDNESSASLFQTVLEFDRNSIQPIKGPGTFRNSN